MGTFALLSLDLDKCPIGICPTIVALILFSLQGKINFSSGWTWGNFDLLVLKTKIIAQFSPSFDPIVQYDCTLYKWCEFGSVIFFSLAYLGSDLNKTVHNPDFIQGISEKIATK